MTELLAGLKIETLSRDDWLAEHYKRDQISASRAAGAMGFANFSSPLSNYAELRGEIDGPDTNLPMMLGHMLEPTVATLYEQETGRPTHDPGEFAIIRHPDAPWLFATLDRVTKNKAEEPGPLELKTTGSYSRKDWVDGAPVEYLIQNQVQMMCAQMTWGSLAVLVGNSDFFTHDFLRDDELAERILKSLDKFRSDVMAGNAPDPTWQDGDVIKALHPKDNGKTKHDDSPYAVELLETFEDLKERGKILEKSFDAAKYKVAALIGDNSFLNVKGIRYSYKHQTRLTKAGVMPQHEHLLTAANIEFKPSKTSEFRVLRKAAR